MDVTKQLLELDGKFERHNEGDWGNPFDKTKPGYSSFNDAGIEVETGEFLYAFTRMLKPAHVLETGTHWGVGAAYIGMALKENNEGHLDTVEFLPEIHREAKARIDRLGLSGQVTCHLMDVAKFYPPSPDHMYKLILLDTEPQTRFAELIKFYPTLEPGGFVFIHDLHQHMHQVPNEEHGFAWPYGKLPQEIIGLVNDDKLRPFHFETPRGLTGFYKPHPLDYNWRQ
jgi:predicted O-methyltransferase YrrM